MSKLRVNDVIPANGLNIGIGTAGGNFIVGGASTTVVVNGTFNSTGNSTFDGLVGIGTDNPDGKLAVTGNGYNQINIANNNTPNNNKLGGVTSQNYVGDKWSIIQTYSPSGSNQIYYGSADGSYRGATTHYFYVNSSPTATTGHTEAFRVTSSGNIRFPSGQGIDFSATSDATGMTSELLDDYEEGTWTPQLYIGSTQQTLDVSYGLYRKIGSVVFIKCHVSVSSISGTGGVQVRNLPFTQASGGLNQTALSIQWSGTLNEYAVYANTWSTNNIIQFNISNGTGNTGTLIESDIAANSNFGIAGCYDV